MYGLIGCGNIGRAVAKGLIFNGHPINVLVRDNYLDCIQSKLGQNAKVFSVLGDFLTTCDIVLVAIRTSQLLAFLNENAHVLKKKELVLLQAGNIADIVSQSDCPSDLQYCRAIANINVEAGLGDVVILRTPNKGLENKVLDLFGKIGEVRLVDAPDDLHRLSMVTGCYPAVIGRFLQELIDGALKLGLDSNDALALSLKVFQNTAKTIELGRVEPKAHWRTACSKGGKLEKAMNELDDQFNKDFNFPNWLDKLSKSMVKK